MTEGTRMNCFDMRLSFYGSAIYTPKLKNVVSFYSAMFNKDGPAPLSKKREKMNELVNSFTGE